MLPGIRDSKWPKLPPGYVRHQGGFRKGERLSCQKWSSVFPCQTSGAGSCLQPKTGWTHRISFAFPPESCCVGRKNGAEGLATWQCLVKITCMPEGVHQQSLWEPRFTPSLQGKPALCSQAKRQRCNYGCCFPFAPRSDWIKCATMDQHSVFPLQNTELLFNTITFQIGLSFAFSVT